MESYMDIFGNENRKARSCTKTRTRPYSYTMVDCWSLRTVRS
jgi:hypothetical protein